MRIANHISALNHNTGETVSTDRTTRFAACLVYALAAPTDRRLQADVSYVAGELGIADELDVYDALDELAFAVELLEQAADVTAQRPYHAR